MCFGYRFAVSNYFMCIICVSEPSQLLQLKLILVELQRNFVFYAPQGSSLDSCKVKETVNRAPVHNHVVIRLYDGEKDEDT